VLHLLSPTTAPVSAETAGLKAGTPKRILVFSPDQNFSSAEILPEGGAEIEIQKHEEIPSTVVEIETQPAPRKILFDAMPVNAAEVPLADNPNLIPLSKSAYKYLPEIAVEDRENVNPNVTAAMNVSTLVASWREKLMQHKTRFAKPNTVTLPENNKPNDQSSDDAAEKRGCRMGLCDEEPAQKMMKLSDKVDSSVSSGKVIATDQDKRNKAKQAKEQRTKELEEKRAKLQKERNERNLKLQTQKSRQATAQDEKAKKLEAQRKERESKARDRREGNASTKEEKVRAPPASKLTKRKAEHAPADPSFPSFSSTVASTRKVRESARAMLFTVLLS
jgi:hypothetical protein